MKSKGSVISIVLVCLVVAFSFLSVADAKILTKGSGSGEVPAFIRVGACYDSYDFESSKVVSIDTVGWVYFCGYEYCRWFKLDKIEQIWEVSCD